MSKSHEPSNTDCSQTASWLVQLRRAPLPSYPQRSVVFLIQSVGLLLLFLNSLVGISKADLGSRVRGLGSGNAES